jgi:hypothetical protein
MGLRSLGTTALLAAVALSCSDGSSNPSSAGGNGGALSGGGAGVTGSGGSTGGSSGNGASGGGAGVTGSGGSLGGNGGSTGGSGGSTGGSGGSCSTDMCPAPNGGVEWLCRYRFMYGINYAWHYFAGDFGGISPWNQQGVAANSAAISADLADMRAHGVSVVRWWVFPDFRGDGVVVNSAGTATGLGGTALADLARALELANQHDLYLMLTLFSFDGFRPARDEAGTDVPSLSPMVTDTTKLNALLENVVRPFARAAEASPHRDRLIAWDVINEPEWAMQGPSPYGDENYDPNSELTAVSHSVMESFVDGTIAVLRQESGALVSVGGAAMKWKRAWSAVDVDFHHFHMYGWVNEYWPYDRSVADYELNDKPVVMGEFPLGNLTPSDPYGTVVSTWWNLGYSGALGWQYNEATATQLDDVVAFTSQQGCEKKY